MKKGRVVYIKNKRIKKGNSLNVEALSSTLNAGLQTLFSNSDPLESWRNLFSSKELIAIKVNCLAGKGLSTHTELVQAIIMQLRKVGISKKNIIVFDRANQDLKRAGFKIETSRSEVRCAGNDYFGYHSNLLVHRSIGSMVSNVLVDADAIINVSVLKDHGITGLSIALKNFFGAINNPNKYHLNIGDPYIPDLCSHPYVKDKTRLTVCDAITVQYEAGPPYMPQYALSENALMLSQDMVAMDRVGWKKVDRWRAQNNLPSLKEAGREPRYILTAADEEHKLGEANQEKINLKELRI